MSVTNPFPLNITLKVDSPQLLAFLAQFGESKFASASDFNKIFQALDYLYENMGSGGSALFLGDFVSVEALQAEHPSPVAGNTANIIVEFGSNDLAVWDNDDSQWIIYPGAGYSFSIPTFQEITEQGASSDKDVQVNTLTQPFQASLLDALAGSVRYITQDNKVVFLWPDASKAEFWKNGQFGNGTINLGLPRISGQAVVKKMPYPISTGDYTIVNEDTDRVIICNTSANLIFTFASLSIGRDFDIYVPSSAFGTVTLTYTGATVAGFSSSPITLEKGYSYKLTRLSTYYQLIKQPEASQTFATVSDLSNKADLVGGLVPSSQLPAFVDDVLEFANLASFPTTGEIGKIYLAISPKNLQYRWSGSSYIAITNGFIASTNDVPEGVNLYYTDARVNALLAAFKTANFLDFQSSGQTQLNGKLATIISSTTQVNNIAVSTEQYLQGYPILANTIPDNCVLNLLVKFFKASSGGFSLTCRVYINTTNSLVGATLIAQTTAGGAAVSDASLYRNIIIRGGNLIILNTSSTLNNDLASVLSSTPSTISFDRSVNQFLIVTFTVPNSSINNLNSVNLIKL